LLGDTNQAEQAAQNQRTKATKKRNYKDFKLERRENEDHFIVNEDLLEIVGLLG
jgi:hypothetical protein